MGSTRSSRACSPIAALLLLGAHVGSFEALRVLAAERPDVKVCALLDTQKTPALTELLHELNPAVARNVIDASRPGTEIVLALGEALNEGALVTLLADRAREGESTVVVDFMGAPAAFPTAPFLIGSLLKVPVGAVSWHVSAAATATISTSNRSPTSSCCRAAGARPSFARWRNVTRRASSITCVRIPTTGSTGMTSGISRVSIATSLALASASLPIPSRAAPEGNAPDAHALVAGLKREAPARTPFSEVRFSGLLDRPLILHGELEYDGPGKLARRVDTPYKENMTIENGEASVQRGDKPVRKFSLSQAPELEGFLRGFAALLGGDADALKRDFELSRNRQRQQLAAQAHAARRSPRQTHHRDRSRRHGQIGALLPYDRNRWRRQRAARRIARGREAADATDAADDRRALPRNHATLIADAI